MIPTNTQPKTIYLKPEEMAFCKRPTIVNTVLGSCLSITMHHQRSRLGAICHAFLPKCPHKKSCQRVKRINCPKRYTYVDCVLPGMINRFRSCGLAMEEVEIKVFGGAHSIGTTRGHTSIGSLNITEAMKVVDRQHLWPKVTDVGGRQGRKIHFFSHTGEVFLKRLNKQLLSKGSCEKKYP